MDPRSTRPPRRESGSEYPTGLLAPQTPQRAAGLLASAAQAASGRASQDGWRSNTDRSAGGAASRDADGTSRGSRGTPAFSEKRGTTPASEKFASPQLAEREPDDSPWPTGVNTLKSMGSTGATGKWVESQQGSPSSPEHVRPRGGYALRDEDEDRRKRLAYSRPPVVPSSLPAGRTGSTPQQQPRHIPVPTPQFKPAGGTPATKVSFAPLPPEPVQIPVLQRAALRANLIEYIADNVIGMMVAGSLREFSYKAVSPITQLWPSPTPWQIAIGNASYALAVAVITIVLHRHACERLMVWWGPEAAQRMFFIMLWPGRPQTFLLADAVGESIRYFLEPCDASCVVGVAGAAVFFLFLAVTSTARTHEVAATGGTPHFASRVMQLFTLTLAGRATYNAWTALILGLSNTPLYYSAPGTKDDLEQYGMLHLLLTCLAPLFYATLLRRRPGDTPTDTALVDTMQFVVLFGWSWDHIDYVWMIGRYITGETVLPDQIPYGYAEPVAPTPWPVVCYGLGLLLLAFGAARCREDRALAPVDGPLWILPVWLMWALQFVFRETWAEWVTVLAVPIQGILCVVTVAWQIGMYEFTAKLRREAMEPYEMYSGLSQQAQGDGAPDQHPPSPFVRRLSDWGPGSDYGTLRQRFGPSSLPSVAPHSVMPTTPLLPHVAGPMVFNLSASPAPSAMLPLPNATGLTGPHDGHWGQRTPYLGPGHGSQIDAVSLVPCPPCISLTTSMLGRAATLQPVQMQCPSPAQQAVRWSGAGYFAATPSGPGHPVDHIPRQDDVGPVHMT